ncbi:hypothetical protein ACKXGF_14375 (plasmid) [Alkalibacillus sp. S2W]|uniref:hypothetical protein n=1 Tax=Alkalibacillus sp. S2W TaxID=3386553 RepID=UPI00398CC021
MHIFYSSPFTKENGFINLDKFIETKDSSNYVLILDANICIYLEKYFEDPFKTVSIWRDSNTELLTDFFDMVKTIRKYHIEYNIEDALNESCRETLRGNRLDSEKFIKRQDRILYLLEDLTLNEVLYPKKPFVSNSYLNDSKAIIESFVKKYDNPETPLNLVLSYINTLKIKQLQRDTRKNPIEKLQHYYDFVINEVGIFSLPHWGVAILIFGDLKLQSGDHMTKLIKTKKKRNLDKKDSYISGIWNAAIDISWLINVSKRIYKGKIPVFVTNDEALNELMKRYGISKLFDDESEFPPIASFDTKGTLFHKKFSKSFFDIQNNVEATVNNNSFDRIKRMRQEKSDGSLYERLWNLKDKLEKEI